MKLRSLAVNQFRKFSEPVRLDGMEDGLNLLVGPNEMGKSTLLVALRAVLFEKYSSNIKRTRELQNARNNAAPVVELTFEVDDATYVIRKRFLKNPYAHLTCPDGRELEGEEAESTLRNLLDFSEPGRSGSQPETTGMWSVLWVTQGTVIWRTDPPSERSFDAPPRPRGRGRRCAGWATWACIAAGHRRTTRGVGHRQQEPTARRIQGTHQ